MININSTIPCNRENYSQEDLQHKYIVMHWTGVVDQTAKGNATYFNREDNLNASAHYFVDDKEIYNSVPIHDIAWHCGSSKGYIHPDARNYNSIGIEMCFSTDENKNQKMIQNAVELVKRLCAIYDISTRNIIRHYDVTGKNCPAPWVNNPDLFSKFKEEVAYVEEKYVIPSWGQEAVDWALKNKILSNPETLNEDLVRNLCFLYRYNQMITKG